MLRFLNFLFKYNKLTFILLMVLLPISVHANCPAHESVRAQKSCRACSGEPAHKNEFYQNSDLTGSFFTQLQQESLKKIEEIQKDPEFQEIVTELQSNASTPSSAFRESVKNEQGNLYIFVSFSMGGQGLLNLAHEAKQFGATLVLRGFRDGSYLKTAQSLHDIILKTRQGVIVDPELYTLFNITAVPTFVLAKPFQLYSEMRTQTPMHDKIKGHVSTHYALEQFAKEGDLKDKAQELLKTGETK